MTSAVLVVLLFPALASGETVKWGDLVKRDGLYYKKFTDVPFTGKTTGITQGSFRNGKKDGPEEDYWKNGQLGSKGSYKDGKPDGPWVGYWRNGTVWKDSTGTFKNGKMIK